MSDVHTGMIVRNARGPVGIVEGVQQDASHGTPHIHVRGQDGSVFSVTPDLYVVEGDSIRIAPSAGQNVAWGSLPEANAEEPDAAASSSATQAVKTIDIAPGQELRIPVIQEQAVARTREVEGGGVRVHKTVAEREEVVQQPTYHEDVEVERVVIGRMVETAPEVREEGDTLIIPVVEEILVVEKRLMLKEELRITRRRSQQTEEVRVMLREEQVRIEPIDGQQGNQ